MRLRRLDLARYGKFTDHSIDFGAAPKGGAPDLHVIYGPNEAGKSTAIAAILDLLYGVEPRSPYNFLHPYPTMKIGARIELAAGPREIQRIKRPQNSLLDGSGQPISEEVLRAELGGVDRDAYCTMFSLDDETLEQGGKSILDSKGDLGELLFSATAGLANLSRSLASLRTQGDAFYKRGAHKTELAELKAKLAELKARREQIDTLATQHQSLVELRDRAREAYQTSASDRLRAQARLKQVERRLAALPRLAKLAAIRRDLEGMPEIPHAPLEWLRDLPGLEKADVELNTLLAGVEAKIDELQGEVEALPLDDTTLSLAAAIEDCAGLRRDHVSAQRDIPSRESERRDAEREIDDILRHLEQADVDDPRRLMPATRTEADLRDMIGAFSGVDMALATARREVDDAQSRLESAVLALKAKHRDGDPQSDAVAQDVLQRCVAKLRKLDAADKVRTLERQSDVLREALKSSMAALAPWRGEPTDLLAMSVPEDALVETWKERFTRARETRMQLQSRLETLRASRLEAAAAIEAFGSVAGLLSDAEALAIRTAREAAWSRHRQALDAATADAFETELRRDDQASAARIAQAGEMARYNHHLLELATLEPLLIDAQRALDAALVEQERDASEARKAAAALGLAETTETDALPARIALFKAARAEALKILETLQACERDLGAARADAADARERLARALAPLGCAPPVEASFDEMLEFAEALLIDLQRSASLRDALESARQNVEHRLAALAKSEAKFADWSAQWRDLCAGCRLFATGATPSVAQASATLAQAARLGPELLKRDVAQDRIAKMLANQQAFAAATQALARSLDLPMSDDADPLASFQIVEQRLAAARKIREQRDGKLADLGKAERERQDLRQKLRLHEARTSAIFDRLSVTSLAEAGGILRDAATRAERVAEESEIIADLVQAVGAETGEAAIAALEHADRDQLETEANELARICTELDVVCEDNRHAQKTAEAKVEAIGGDDAVARIEEDRQTILLEIADKAERFMRIRLGALAAEQALRIYRDRHRGSMMAHASDAFQMISRGAYAKLTTQPEKDAETLVAVSADGASKIASALSKGTRFQLYLALRVAGRREFARNRQPLPFIADDIMETFDDFRAEEAFRLFADMARSGQVIYLTHHRHLVDVAQKVCPQVRVHSLAPEPATPHLVLDSEIA